MVLLIVKMSFQCLLFLREETLSGFKKQAYVMMKLLKKLAGAKVTRLV